MGLYRRRYRFFWWSAALVLVVLFFLLIGMLANIVSRHVLTRQEDQTPRQERVIPNTDVNPFGANFFLEREVEPWKIDKTLHMAADAGIGWVKQHFPWEQIEPERKGEFLDPRTKEDSWIKFDRIVEACEKYNLEIIARLDRPPDWTRQDNTYRQRPPDNFEDYGDFVHAFVSRYKGRIRYIQIWNEPNIFPEWGNQPVDPVAYTELLKVAYRRAKEADPNIHVLSAPLAITLGEPHPEPGQWRSMNDLDYLEAMYAADAGGYFDIFSANVFGMDQPPDSPPDPEVLNFQRVLLQREIMERHGDAEKAVWFNEYGWNAAPESLDSQELIWKRVSEQEQAEYTLQGIRMAREEWPWAGMFMIWYFRQVGNMTPDQAEYYFRMVDVDFTPRRVYFAVQDVAQGLTIAGPGIYQETNPAVERYGSWQHVISSKVQGGAYILSNTPGDSVSFSFKGGQVDLVTRRGPEYGRLLVLLDGQTVDSLEIDDQGASYVSLYSPVEEDETRIPLVRNTGLGEHTLRLIVAPEPAVASGEHVLIDAFQVSAPQALLPTLPLLGILAALAVTIWLISRIWQRLRWSIGIS